MHGPASYLISLEHRGAGHFFLFVLFATGTLVTAFLKLRSLNATIVCRFSFTRLRASQLRLDELLGTWLVQVLLAHVEHEGVRLEVRAVTIDTPPVPAFFNMARSTSRTILFFFCSDMRLLHFYYLTKIHDFRLTYLYNSSALKLKKGPNSCIK